MKIVVLLFFLSTVKYEAIKVSYNSSQQWSLSTPRVESWGLYNEKMAPNYTLPPLELLWLETTSNQHQAQTVPLQIGVRDDDVQMLDLSIEFCPHYFAWLSGKSAKMKSISRFYIQSEHKRTGDDLFCFIAFGISTPLKGFGLTH